MKNILLLQFLQEPLKTCGLHADRGSRRGRLLLKRDMRRPDVGDRRRKERRERADQIAWTEFPSISDHRSTSRSRPVAE